MRERCDLLIRDARLVSVAGGTPGPLASPTWEELGMIDGGALAAREGTIIAAGRAADVDRAVQPVEDARVVDAGGRMLLPGFVDPHTHFLFAGSRDEEYALRVEGVDYLEIRRRGGGIRSSVRAFRAATDGELLEAGRRRLDAFLAAGTTTVEGKSGYGLTVEEELRALRLMRTLDRRHPIDVVPTFLGAHDIPGEYEGEREAYIRLVIEEMIPRVGDLALFCDVFCEEGVFSVAESRRILEAGKACGLRPKLHAEEFASIGGGELAGAVGAVSADHLLAVTGAGCAALAAGGVIAVLLPGTAIGLARRRFADVALFREHGVPIALGTDCNPGSSYAESMAPLLSLACSLEHLTVPEAIFAATRNAAAAIDRLDAVGTLEAGKRADCILVGAEHPAALPCRFGVNLVEAVFKGGVLAGGAPAA